MAGSIDIGVDFGSTGLRVAYAAQSGEIVVLADAVGARWPWLLCERSPTNRLEMAFPSLKSKLGTAVTLTVDGGQRRLTELVTEAFCAIKRTVEAQASNPVGRAVISVPARYSASQRAALREAVLQAGFADVHLINDSVAAVIAHTAQSEGGTTALVYSMGYAGFEIGLVRAMRGHYRALGYEGGTAPSGQALDELLLRALLGLLAQNNLFLDTARWDASVWMQVRAAAQQAKEGLSVNTEVPFPIPVLIPDGKRVVEARFTRAGFEEVVISSFRATLDLALELI